MNKLLHYALLSVLISLNACNGDAQEITLVSNNSSAYTIVLPPNPAKIEQRAANVLKDYIARISGVTLTVGSEKPRSGTPAIYIGNTEKADNIFPARRKPESYLIQTSAKDIVICGGSGHGVMYGVYRFIETYLHCKKLSNDPAIIPVNKTIKIPGDIHDEHAPLFEYRECYYPASHDAGYLEWHQLQQLDDLWGVWGHSYNKLVPAQTYFKSHPEYFALVKGKRQATQLCLSNEDVYKIVKSELKTRMDKNPDAVYWSISPNDDNGFCECDKCRATDNEQGSHSGSLIKFVNRVAAAFPDKKFTTLAYGYTHKAPKNLRPAGNVYVFLSDIDACRDKPLEQEGSAATFRTDLKAWNGLTKNIFIWDYVTEFTNYLAPFPNFQTLQPNMKYFKDNGVKGIFVQGSGDTYSEWAELRSYVIAKLLQDDKADVNQLVSDFMKDYYGKAAPYLQKYFDMVEQKMLESKRKLDIYGNPINEWKSYLTPELLDQYSNLFDKAEGAVESDPVLAARVMRARLPLEYTVLQQARFYGIEKHGIFVKDNAGKWSVKPKFEDKVARFVANCKKAGVTELSEAGPARHPDEYLAEWNMIFKLGVRPTKALDAKVTLQYPFAEDYPAKGNHTLVDGNPGYNDFSYNWLCFYGTDMVATIDLGTEKNVAGVQLHFLDDPRHWIFLPETILVEWSNDGMHFQSATEMVKDKSGEYRIAKAANTPKNEEHYEVSLHEYRFMVPMEKSFPIRYLRVNAKNLKLLPEWRYREGKNPMIACDEIYVQ